MIAEGTIPRVKATKLIRPHPAPDSLDHGGSRPPHEHESRPQRRAKGESKTSLRAAVSGLDRPDAGGDDRGTARRDLPLCKSGCPAEVVRVVCAGCGIATDAIIGNGRHPRVVTARMLCTRMMRLFTLLSYPEIAVALARPNHSTMMTCEKRLDAILRLPREDTRRKVPWHGQMADLSFIIDDLIARMNKRATPVQDDIVTVLRDGEPRTTREIAIDVLLMRHEPITTQALNSLRKAAATMASHGKLEKRGARANSTTSRISGTDDSMVWCYTLPGVDKSNPV